MEELKVDFIDYDREKNTVNVICPNCIVGLLEHNVKIKSLDEDFCGYTCDTCYISYMVPRIYHYFILTKEIPDSSVDLRANPGFRHANL